MASRVNTRFVIILSAVLVLVFGGVAGMAYFVLTRSGSELEKAGDKKMAERDYKAAMLLYGKAFAHDRNRADRVVKYRDAIMAWTPDKESEYENAYRTRLMGSLTTLAQLQPMSVESQEELLREVHKQFTRGGVNADAARNLAELAGDSIAPFEASSSATPGWERLRRYRGLALLALHQADSRALTEDDRQKLEADLRAALAADRADDEAAVGLARWLRAKAVLAEQSRDPAGAKALRAESESSLAAHAAANPQSLPAAVNLLQFRLENAFNAVTDTGNPGEVMAARMAATAALQGDFNAVAAACLAAPERATAQVVDHLVSIERFVTAGKATQSLAVLNAVIEKRPQDADALAMAAQLAVEEGRYDDAISSFRRITSLPIPPVSLEGVILWSHQTNAVRRQAEVLLAQWQQAEPSAKPALLDAVRAQRDALDARLPSEHEYLTLLDAKIKVAEGNRPAAQRLLIAFNRKTEDRHPEGLRLLAQVERELNRPGEARRLWQRLREIEPDNVAVLRELAALLLEMQDYDAADRICTDILRRDPQSEWAHRMKSTIAVIRGTGTADPASLADEPVMALMREALLIANEKNDGTPGDPAAALDLLEKALPQHNGDAKIYDLAIIIAAQIGQWDKARELADAAAAAHPDHQRLADLRRIVNTTDPVDRQLVQIEVGPGTEMEKLAARHRILKEAGRDAEAAAILADLDARGRDDPVAVELLFVNAINAKNLPRARSLADHAAAKNLDRVEGLTFKARLQMNEGSPEQAIATLRQATKMGTATAETWRLLGALLLGEARYSEALQVFQEARRLKPLDLVSTLGYLNAQVRLDMLPEALRTAREASRFARDNAEFMTLWLQLEEAVGDKQAAALRREAVLKADPANVENRKALAKVYIALTEWSKARAIIDGLRTQGDSLELVRLDAIWSADQGDFDRSEKLFRDYIATLPPATPGEPNAAHEEARVALGVFLVARGMTDKGLEALREARAYEDPKSLHAARALGAALFQVRGNEAQAAEVLREVVRAGADDAENSMRARLTESLVSLQRYDEADAVIAQLGAKAQGDLALMLLQADIHRGRKDPAQARALLDRLVKEFPEEGLVYVKRAETMREVAYADPANLRRDLIEDAIADCTSALRVRPKYWQALQLRAILRNDLGERDPALADLRAAVQINPDLDGARDAIIREYLNAGRIQEAFAVATEAIDQKPRDLPTIIGIGDIFFDGSFWPQSSRIYERAWAIARTGPVAARYALAVLRSPSPDLAKADAILAAKEIPTEQAPPLLMTRALLRSHQTGGARLAREDAAKAIHLTIDTGPENTGLMIDRLAEVLRAPGEMVDFMNQHLNLSRLPDQWAQVYRAKILLSDPTRSVRAGARPLLEDALAKSQDPVLKLTVRRFLGTILLGEQNYEAMVELCRQGLLENPAGDDPQTDVEKSNTIEMNNNIAYVLCENLKRPEEALPFAEKAVSLAPSSPQVLDTLGVVLLRLNRLSEAEQYLSRARSIYAPAEAHIACTIHLGLVKVLQKDCDEAREMLRVAEAILADYPVVAPDYKDSLADLRGKIEAECK